MRLTVCVPLVVLACRPQAAPPHGADVPHQPVPAALAPRVASLLHARTPAGLAVALHIVDPADVDTFSATLVLPGGQSDADDGSALVFAELLREASLTHLSDSPGRGGPPVVKSALDAVGAVLEARAGARHTVLNVTGALEDAPLGIRALCATAFQPGVSNEDWDRAVHAAWDISEQRLRGSHELVDEVLLAELFPGHALGRSRVPHPDVLENLSLQHVMEWRCVLGRVEQGLLLVTASDPEAAWNAARSCRPSCRAEPTPPNPAAPGAPRAPRIIIETLDAANAFIRLGGPAPPAGSIDAMLLDVLLQGVANGFSSALVSELRTRRGLVYGVEGGLGGTADRGYWYVSTSAATAHANEIARSFLEHLRTLHRDGVSAAAWERLSHAWALGFARGTEDDSTLLAMEADGFQLQRRPGEAALMPAVAWSTSWEEAWPRIRPWLEPERSVLVVAGGGPDITEDPTFPYDRHLSAADWPPEP